MLTFFRLVGQGLRQTALHPWAQLLTLAAVTLVAFLAGFFLLFVFNLESWVASQSGEVEFQVYWKPDTQAPVVAEQWKKLKAMPRLTSLRTFTPEEALKSMADALGGDFGWLGKENPLPPTALARFKLPPKEPQLADDVHKELLALPGVAEVRFNPLQLQAAKNWAAMGRQAVLVLSAFLALVAGLSVGNTVRLSLLSRQDEIEILRLVGATRGYIRLPMLINAGLQGLAGGAAALGLLKGAQTGLNMVLGAPPLFLKIAFLPPEMAAGLVGGLVLVCILASYVAISR